MAIVFCLGIMKIFKFLAVFLFIKVPTLSESTIALTIVPFILPLVKVMSFLSC